MSLITLPDNSFRSVQWTLVQPTQVNRSEFTSARQVMQLPGASYWKASADHVPIVGEAGVLAWRAFFAKMRGQSNTFRLQACESSQIATNVSLRPIADANSTMVAGFTSSTVTLDATKTIATKTAGANAFDCAVTSDYLPAPSVLSFKVPVATSDIVVGLRSAADPDFGTTSIVHAFRFFSGGTFQVRNLEVNLGTATAYSASDIFSIVHSTDGAVRFYRNSNLQFSTTTAATQFAFDSSFASVGSKLSEIGFSHAGQGQRTRTLTNMPASTTFMKAGQFLTFFGRNGTEQLVVLTEDLVSGSDGRGTATFEPALRFNVPGGFPLTYQLPTCLMAMDSAELGYSVDPGALYGLSFSATEAF